MPLQPSRRDILGPPPRDTTDLARIVRHHGSYLRSLEPGIQDGRFATPRPVPGVGAQLVGGDGGGEGGEELAAWDADQTTATAAGKITLNLTYEPIENTLLVFWNGVRQLPTEWTLDEQTVTFTEPDVHVGDNLSAYYWYLPSDDDPLNGPIWWARLNEPSGTTGMFDFSEYNRAEKPGYTSVGRGATSLLTGDTDPAASFNGSVSHADLFYDPWMDTIASGFLLFKSSGTGLQAIMSRYVEPGGYLWTLLLNGGNLELRTGFFFGATVTVATTGLALNDGVRHGVGFSADGTNLHIYVDGTPRASAAGVLPTGSVGLTLGGVRAGGGGSYLDMFNGVLDEPKLFDVALTDTDHATLWASS